MRPVHSCDGDCSVAAGKNCGCGLSVGKNQNLQGWLNRDDEMKSKPDYTANKEGCTALGRAIASKLVSAATSSPKFTRPDFVALRDAKVPKRVSRATICNFFKIGAGMAVCKLFFVYTVL